MPTLTPSPDGAPDAAQYAHKWVIAGTVTLAAVLELIDTSIINVALAQMSANLGATLDEIAWVSTGYIIAAVIVLPMTGWLSAVLGRTRYYIGSILLFTVASLLCGQSTSLFALVFWRVVQGLGGGALIATSQAILIESFPARERTLASAIFGIGMMVGPAVGPTLGGVIVDNYSWPWIFFINVPLGLCAAVLAALYTRPPADARRPAGLDLPGIALLVVGFGALQFVLERGEHYAWFDSSLIRASSVLAVIGLAAFVAWELRAPHPVINLRVLRDRSLSAGSVVAMALGVGLYGSVFAVPIYTQQLLGFDATQAGWVLFPGAVGSAAAILLVGRFGTRVADLRYVIVLGAVCLVAGMWLHAEFTTASGGGDMLIPIVLRGMGTGFMFVPLATTAVTGLRGRDLAEGTAIFNLSRQLGGSIGIAVLATELTRRTDSHRARLVEAVTDYDGTTLQRLALLSQELRSHGVAPTASSREALAILNAQLQRQATMLAFIDVFHLVAFVMACSIPLVMLLRRPAKGNLLMTE